MVGNSSNIVIKLLALFFNLLTFLLLSIQYAGVSKGEARVAQGGIQGIQVGKEQGQPANDSRVDDGGNSAQKINDALAVGHLAKPLST